MEDFEIIGINTLTDEYVMFISKKSEGSISKFSFKLELSDKKKSLQKVNSVKNSGTIKFLKEKKIIAGYDKTFIVIDINSNIKNSSKLNQIISFDFEKYNHFIKKFKLNLLLSPIKLKLPEFIMEIEQFENHQNISCRENELSIENFSVTNRVVYNYDIFSGPFQRHRAQLIARDPVPVFLHHGRAGRLAQVSPNSKLSLSSSQFLR